MNTNNSIYLQTFFPKVRKYLTSADYEPLNVGVFQAKNKQQTLKVKLDERELFIHSSYHPEREAYQILNKELKRGFDSDTHVVFFGLGLGYHIAHFTKQYQQNTYSIIEPSVEIFNVALDLIQLEDMLNSNLSHLFVGDMYSVIQMVNKVYKDSTTRVEVVVLPAYNQLFSEKLNEFFLESKKIIRGKRTELATNYNFQFNWIENSIKNHKHVLNTKNILAANFKEMFKGKPAIIVSAGPSLSEDIESIRYIKQNSLAYIFSVGSAINTLIAYDIMPDAVFSYDPGDRNHLVFEKMIDQGKDTIPLVYGSSVGHQLLEKYRGPKYHFITSQDYSSRLFLGDQISASDLIIDSPSIAVMTFQIVNKLSMSPIIFAGQNLGYLYNRRYAQGVDYDFINSELTEQEVNRAEEVKDVYGNNIKTNAVFNSMRNALEQSASTFKGEYYNTTKGGAAIKGIPFKTIEDVIDDDLQQSIDKKIWPINKKSYDLSDYDKKKKDTQLSYESFIEGKTRLEYILNKIEEEKGKKKLEKLFTKIDNELTKFESNQFFTHFVVQSIRVEHNLLVQQINRTAKKETLEKKRDIIQMFQKYFSTLETVTTKLVDMLHEEGIIKKLKV